MHAVIRSGGKQYRVAPGAVVTVERLAGEAGEAVTFGEVLMVSDGGRSLVGAPLLENVSVTGTVAEQLRSPRVIVFKKKRRKHHRKRRGHRQQLTVVRINDISVPGREEPVAAEPAVRPEAPAAAEAPTPSEPGGAPPDQPPQA